MTSEADGAPTARQLEIFATLMSSRSVTEAALRLSISQPAVSKALRLLEAQLDVPLFERRRGHLHPSPEANALYARLHPVLGKLDAVRRFASELRLGSAVQLRIATAPTAAASYLPIALHTFSSCHPTARVEIKVLMTRDVADAVARHEVDFGIGPAPAKDIDARAMALCDTIDLCENDLVVVAPADHPLARLRHVAPRDLVNERLAVFPDETPVGVTLRATFRAAGEPFRPAVLVNQTTVLCSIVREGHAVSVINSLALYGGAFRDLTIRLFRPRLPQRTCVYLSRYRPPSQLGHDFVAGLFKTGQHLRRNLEIPIRLFPMKAIHTVEEEHPVGSECSRAESEARR